MKIFSKKKHHFYKECFKTRNQDLVYSNSVILQYDLVARGKEKGPLKIFKIIWCWFWNFKGGSRHNVTLFVILRSKTLCPELQQLFYYNLPVDLWIFPNLAHHNESIKANHMKGFKPQLLKRIFYCLIFLGLGKIIAFF